MKAYVVIWHGGMRTPLPGVGGIERRGNYLTDQAMIQTDAEIRRTPKRERLASTDAEAKRQLAVYAADRIPCSTGCGRLVGKLDQRSYRRCGPCRERKEDEEDLSRR